MMRQTFYDYRLVLLSIIISTICRGQSIYKGRMFAGGSVNYVQQVTATSFKGRPGVEFKNILRQRSTNIQLRYGYFISNRIAIGIEPQLFFGIAEQQLITDTSNISFRNYNNSWLLSVFARYY